MSLDTVRSILDGEFVGPAVGFDSYASLEFYGEDSSEPLEHNEISDETLEFKEQVRKDDHEPYGEHLNIEGYADGPIGEAEEIYNQHVPLEDDGL